MQRHEEWINRAISSLEVARTRNSNLVYYEDLCFQAQQAAEKALKGLLIYNQIEPEFTHNIGLLLNNLGKVTNIPDEMNETIKLTKYAVQTRYPGQYDDVTKKDYDESIRIAKMCLEWVQSKMAELRLNDPA
jgi:HEPN domain-containing protein